MFWWEGSMSPNAVFPIRQKIKKKGLNKQDYFVFQRLRNVCHRDDKAPGEEIIISANSGLPKQWHHCWFTDFRIQAGAGSRETQAASLSDVVQKRRHKEPPFESWRALRLLSWPFVKAHDWTCRRLTPLTFL